MRRLEPHEYDTLFSFYGDTIDTLIPFHQLRHRRGHATLIGTPEAPRGVVIQANDEPTTFGDDAEAIWQILQHLTDWFCVEIAIDVGRKLLPLMQSRYASVRWYESPYYVLDGLPIKPHAPEIETRLLTPADIPLWQNSPDFSSTGFKTHDDVLREGFAAASFVDGRMVAIAQTYALSEKYADIGVFTAEAYRKRGLSTYAAALVMEQVAARGQIPAWSTGADNLASQRVALKLGMKEVLRRVYLIPTKSQ